MTIKEYRIQKALGTLSYHMTAKLAYDRNTSPELLAVLIKNEDWLISHWAIENLNTPKEISIKL